MVTTRKLSALMGPMQDLYRTRKVQAPWSPPKLFTGSLWSINPSQTSKLTMHALKLHRPCTGRQKSDVLLQVSPMHGHMNFVQNSPGSASVGPGNVMWLGRRSSKFYCPCCAISGLILRFAPSQWETVLLCNGVSHWLGTNLESALYMQYVVILDSVIMRLHWVSFQYTLPYSLEAGSNDIQKQTLLGKKFYRWIIRQTSLQNCT